MLAHSLPFDPRNPASALDGLPEKPGIFALFGIDPKAEPYLARTTNIRRRLKRFLDAKPTQTRRLRLTERVSRIEYSVTGSDFETALALYAATLEAFGERARKRIRLRPPYFLRMTVKNRYPRVYVTNTITRSVADALYGPFPSRAAAERFCDEALNLFLLRRCYPDLDPDPAFPGCLYSEMKMCLAPCFKGCTDERYDEEVARVEAFLATRGQSLLDELSKERDAASEAEDFEKAAALHLRMQKTEAVAALTSEAFRPLARLRAMIVQPAMQLEDGPGQVALFLLSSGILAGPAFFSVFGMRLHNEQSGSSSLYTHPFAVEAVALQSAAAPSAAPGPKEKPREVLEQRLIEATETLNQARLRFKSDTQKISDHLCLFARWYYRPEAKRIGEVIFFEPDQPLPSAKILRAISRVYRGALPVHAASIPTAPQGGEEQAIGSTT